MGISQGRTACPDKWEELFWVNSPGSAVMGGSLAVRKLRVDGQWYVTYGYMEAAVMLHGPYPSREAVEMLLEMGALEL